jgi:hypothetical protein
MLLQRDPPIFQPRFPQHGDKERLVVAVKRLQKFSKVNAAMTMWLFLVHCKDSILTYIF